MQQPTHDVIPLAKLPKSRITLTLMADNNFIISDSIGTDVEQLGLIEYAKTLINLQVQSNLAVAAMERARQQQVKEAGLHAESQKA